MAKLRLTFLLRKPNTFDWRRDPDFNARVHKRLLTVHERVTQSIPTTDGLAQIETALLRLRSYSMSQRQEMLLYYLLAQCARARDLTLSAHFCQALEWCGRAEHIALVLQDRGAQVDLHELRGTLHRAVSMFWVAAEEFSRALQVMREHAEDGESFDPEFEVTLAAKAAALDYLLGAFSRALDHLQRAAVLLPLTTMSVTGQGTVAWVFALLHRQRNDLTQALWHVEVAAELYRQLGATNSTCRVLSLAADIALDVTASAAREARAPRDEHLALAARYVEEALHVGQEAEDPPGIELARLSLARLERMRGATGVSGAEASIRAVIRQARKMRDDSLMIAAQTELGVDLLARGEWVAGKRWLRKAIATATRINTPGLAFRAQRRLRLADGRNA